MRYPCIKMRSLKFKHIAFVVGSLAIYLVLFYTFFDSSQNTKISVVKLKHVVVHIDLKGAAPRLQYLERLLTFFTKHKVNGILLEYEDMFPYEGNLVNLSSRNCYNKAELRNFLMKVKEFNIEVIPLIQTFGHMEYVLKLEEFRHLREEDMCPDSICPSNDESIELVKQMLEQVIDFHKDITGELSYIHIGCDEVYHLNKCPKCCRRKISNTGIFIKHLQMLSKIIYNISPHTTILVWYDMLYEIKTYRWRKETAKQLQNVEPVYWDYSSNPEISHINLFQLHKKFSNIWIASAFKGADGRDATLPDLKTRFTNHYAWMRIISDYIFGGEQNKFDFKGIIITGWSRYSHMDPLCELLPPAIPSLVLNLRLIQKYTEGVIFKDNTLEPDEFFVKYIATEFFRDLNCQDKMYLDIEDLDIISELCNFESRELFSLLKNYTGLKLEVDGAIIDQNLGLTSIELNAKLNNLNMNGINSTRAMSLTYLKELQDWGKKLAKEMSKFFDSYVIEEYAALKLYPLEKKFRDTLRLLDDHIKIRTWDRRPYNVDNALY